MHSKMFAYAACIWWASIFSAFAATPLTKVVVGYAAMNGRVSPLWIADEQGFLAKYGLQADQVYVRGAPLLVAGMASGDIQFGRSGGSATLAAVGAGYDLKLSRRFPAATAMTSSPGPTSSARKIYAVKKLRSTVLAVPAGWVCSFGSNI